MSASPTNDDADQSLSENTAETRLDAIADSLRAEKSLQLMQIKRKPNQIIVSRGELSTDFTFANMGNVSEGQTVISAVFRVPGAIPQQLAVITRWDAAEFLDRLKKLQDLAPNVASAVQRIPMLQVPVRFGAMRDAIERRLAGVAGNAMKIEGKTFTVHMTQRGERHVFTYVDRGGGKAVIEVRTTMLRAPMEVRRLPDIRVWEAAQFLDVLTGNRWKDGIVEEE